VLEAVVEGGLTEDPHGGVAPSLGAQSLEKSVWKLRHLLRFELKRSDSPPNRKTTNLEEGTKEEKNRDDSFSQQASR
jgi:hypothetical protein